MTEYEYVDENDNPLDLDQFEEGAVLQDQYGNLHGITYRDEPEDPRIGAAEDARDAPVPDAEADHLDRARYHYPEPNWK